MRAAFREILITFLIAVAIFTLLRTTVQNFRVEGSSMEPNIHEEQYILVNKAVYSFHPPQRGEIIVFLAPNSGGRDYIKRVIGIPGDIIEVKKGDVYVNETLLYEPYIEDPPSYSLTPQEIPPEFYFVLGDNRNRSNDSHNGWLVPHENIIGKAWIYLWPPQTWGLAPQYDPSTEVEITGRAISFGPILVQSRCK